MGLIKAAIGATAGVLGDQWKEYFYCESLSADVLCCKGSKKTTSRSSNKKGDENIISKGSVIAVPAGTCMIILDQGKITEVCAEPGEYIYDSSTEPTIFGGNFKQGFADSVKNIGKRFTFGGQSAKDQRVYFINMKEIPGNKYGTPTAVPFRVVDERAGIDIDISIRCFGEYSYRIENPVTFFVNVCGNSPDCYTRDGIDGQLKSELLTSLQPAFARISALGIRYSAVPGHTQELGNALRLELNEKWLEHRGIKIETVGVSSLKADEEDEKMLKSLQRDAAFMDTTRAAAHLVGAQAEAMKSAASNPNGAAMAFMGMNMAQQAGGFNPQALYGMNNNSNAQPQSVNAVPSNTPWKCKCGVTNTGKFCSECGSPKPSEEWICSCGTKNKGKFCPECGSKRPE